MHAEIIDRGRGPEIAGTRITVLDVLDYWQDGWHHTAIAALFDLTSEQVLAAIRHIEGHQDELKAARDRAVERASRGNAPEVEARREASRAKLQALLERNQAAGG